MIFVSFSRTTFPPPDLSVHGTESITVSWHPLVYKRLNEKKLQWSSKKAISATLNVIQNIIRADWSWSRVCLCFPVHLVSDDRARVCAEVARDTCALHKDSWPIAHPTWKGQTDTQGDPIQPVKLSTDTETFHLGRREMKDRTSSFYSHTVSIHTLYSCCHERLSSLVFLFFTCHRLSFFLPFSEDLWFLSSKVSGGRKFAWFIIFLL